MMSKKSSLGGEDKNAALLECVLTRDYPIKYTASHHIYIYIYVGVYYYILLYKNFIITANQKYKIDTQTTKKEKEIQT